MRPRAGMTASGAVSVAVRPSGVAHHSRMARFSSLADLLAFDFRPEFGADVGARSFIMSSGPLPMRSDPRASLESGERSRVYSLPSQRTFIFSVFADSWPVRSSTVIVRLDIFFHS